MDTKVESIYIMETAVCCLEPRVQTTVALDNKSRLWLLADPARPSSGGVGPTAIKTLWERLPELPNGEKPIGISIHWTSTDFRGCVLTYRSTLGTAWQLYNVTKCERAYSQEWHALPKLPE